MTAPPSRRPAWYLVDPPPAERPTTVVEGDSEYVVFPTGDGVGAIEAWCPHRGAHLGNGTLTQEGLVCPLHGWCWAADGANTRCGGEDRHVDARAATIPTGGSPERPLVWLGSRSPDHDPVDLADGLPDDPAARIDVTLDLGSVDPTLLIENAFDAAHVPIVHGRAAVSVDAPTIGDERARITHHDHERDATTDFEAYRASQLLVRIGTSRPELDLWVHFAVLAGSGSRAAVRYVSASAQAEPALARFARHHRRELDRDLEIFSTQRPDRGSWWGPQDDALRAYRTWIDDLGP